MSGSAAAAGGETIGPRSVTSQWFSGQVGKVTGQADRCHHSNPLRLHMWFGLVVFCSALATHPLVELLEAGTMDPHIGANANTGPAESAPCHAIHDESIVLLAYSQRLIAE